MPASLMGRRRPQPAAVPILGWALPLLLFVATDPGLAEVAKAPEELAGLGQFKARFNQDAGTPRLVLLLSPT